MPHRLPRTSRSLPIALLRAREHVMGPVRLLLSESGVTEQQWRVLRVVEENGAIDPTQIAEHSCLLLPSLTRILQKLEEKGFIARARDTQDRRRQLISVTDEGRALIAANIDAALELTEDTRSKLGAERYDLLLDLLNELYLENEDPEKG
ncbi:homoprotocatechuate degradation operon regulator HpaR [Epibacterium sp. SM1979]|uniref:Homoprotocatechuate degradation operon regulator HpaR n=1 Tax=Tritonibacter litoralis TaxID=2662264 RepID=A0A843YC77_9RHOB|nr:homoprotocatechuate degradation operon regulator HpaR [Tritonibacter litoralis]MQQ08606.1 homoprotocatechuate degradation operon regulator HpaR [Tritonibacter litoralis]